MKESIIRVPFHKMKDTLTELFLSYSFTEEKARLLAHTYTDSTMAGIRSHGINRVPLFLEYVEKGWVDPAAEAEKKEAFGSLERWDGNRGPGIINAVKCTGRAVELAKKLGMGLVALRNTNHWMRGGTYGRQAANAGCIGVMFTNTQPNMPPWGGRDSRIGNNPFVMAIPREQGHVILDMALSQFAFGKINDYRLRGIKLPFPGGWDEHGQLSDDPEKILIKERGLPIGYWKGSALSMVLDMMAAVLSAGDSTHIIGSRDHESGLSQVFLCIYPEVIGDREWQEKLINEVIEYTREVPPMHPGDKVYYPGEQSEKTRARNLKEGIPVNRNVWQRILDLSAR